MAIHIKMKSWLEVYNALLVFQYFVYLHNQDPSKINAAQSAYHLWLRQQKNIKETPSLWAGTNSLSFAYLLHVRTFEIIKTSCDSEIEKTDLFKQITDEWQDQCRLRSTQDVLDYYAVTPVLYNGPDVLSADGLEYFCRRIRNSFSHFRYTLTGATLTLKDRPRETAADDFVIEFSLPRLLTFVADIATCLNAVGIRQGLIRN